MKYEGYPVLIVVKCKDCGYEVGSLLLGVNQKPEKMTKQERFWLVHMALADAIKDGTMSQALFEEHNTEAELMFK